MCLSLYICLSLAENILKLSELARKYETEQEKVLPFYSPLDSMLPVTLPEAPLSSATATGSSSRLRGGKMLEGVAEEEGEESQETGSGDGLGAGSGKGRGRGKGAPLVGSDGQPNFSAAGLDPDGVVVEEWDYLNRFFKKTNKVGACK